MRESDKVKYGKLLCDMKAGLDGFRYSHVESVYNECVRLSGLFGLTDDESDTLVTAAILHDIAKPFDRDSGQIALADGLGIILTDDDAASYKTLHAITGAALAQKCYPEMITEGICECIRWHSTGKADMSIPEKLLYLADYIEPTRKFDDCKYLREYFYGLIEKGVSPEAALDAALLVSLDMTIKELVDMRANIHPDSLKARNFLLNIVKRSGII